LFLKLGHFSKPGREKSFDLALKVWAKRSPRLPLRSEIVSWSSLHSEIVMLAFWRLSPLDSLQWMEEKMIPYYPLGVIKDEASLSV